MTGRALRLVVEECLAASGGCRIETAFRGNGRRDGKLIIVKRRKLPSDQIRAASHISESCFRGYWELDGIIQPRIEERSLAVHLKVCDERIPVCGRAKSGRSAKVHAGKTESRRDQCGS